MTPPHTEKPPDGNEPFTPEERALLRSLIQKAPVIEHIVQEEEHATWLRGRIKVFWPWIAAAVTAVVAAVDWVQKHIKWTGS